MSVFIEKSVKSCVTASMIFSLIHFNRVFAWMPRWERFSSSRNSSSRRSSRLSRLTTTGIMPLNLPHLDRFRILAQGRFREDSIVKWRFTLIALLRGFKRAQRQRIDCNKFLRSCSPSWSISKSILPSCGERAKPVALMHLCGFRRWRHLLYMYKGRTLPAAAAAGSVALMG